MIAGLTNANFVNNCISLEIEGTTATAIREIDGGKETVSTALPLVIGGQKGLVEESDLRIPNMRGIMMARQKPLTVAEPIDANAETNSVSFKKQSNSKPLRRRGTGYGKLGYKTQTSSKTPLLRRGVGVRKKI